MTRDRSAPSEGDFTRAVLEAAIAALPALLRTDGCAILLPSAERNALRGVARRDLSEPQVQALTELLMQREVSDLLTAGRPFLPRAGDGISPALQARLREEGWPDLIAVPLPGTGRPVGVLALVPEADGRWTSERIEAAMRAGMLLATSLRAAVRATEGERRRRQVASLLERLPLVTDRTVGAEGALNQVVAGVGSALGLTHCLGVLMGSEPAFAEYCQPGATPVGAPSAAAGHPMWGPLQTGGLWSFDEGEAPAVDRSATGHLLNGLHPRSMLAVPIGQRGALGGYLLLLQAERHRRFIDEERRFAHAAALELAGLAAMPPPQPRPVEGDAIEERSAASAAASLAAASSAAEVADALVAALPERAGIEALVLARWDETIRRLMPLVAMVVGVVQEAGTFAAVPLGDDLASTALRDGEAASGLGTHAMPRPWRPQYRPPRSTRALAMPLTVGTRERYLLLVIARDERTLAELAPALRALAPVAGLSL
ncbi:MAG: GAF domain-containing protein, partial [Dehalococcoidia bacterium]